MRKSAGKDANDRDNESSAHVGGLNPRRSNLGADSIVHRVWLLITREKVAYDVFCLTIGAMKSSDARGVVNLSEAKFGQLSIYILLSMPDAGDSKTISSIVLEKMPDYVVFCGLSAGKRVQSGIVGDITLSDEIVYLMSSDQEENQDSTVSRTILPELVEIFTQQADFVRIGQVISLYDRDLDPWEIIDSSETASAVEVNGSPNPEFSNFISITISTDKLSSQLSPSCTRRYYRDLILFITYSILKSDIHTCEALKKAAEMRLCKKIAQERKLQPYFIRKYEIRTREENHKSSSADLVKKWISDITKDLELDGIWELRDDLILRGLFELVEAVNGFSSTIYFENSNFCESSEFSDLIAGAAAGNSYAHMFIGLIFKYGLGVPVHYDKGWSWLNSSRILGNALACCELARMHLDGMGTLSRNPEIAMNLIDKEIPRIRKMADAGYLPAESVLSYNSLFLKGSVGATEKERSIVRLKEDAKNNIISLFSFGEHTFPVLNDSYVDSTLLGSTIEQQERLVSEAARYYLEAAQRDLAVAKAAFFACSVYRGNAEEVLDMLRDAEENNEPMAFITHGKHLMRREGGSLDSALAMFKRALHQRKDLVYALISDCYSKMEDEDKESKYEKLAAEHGNLQKLKGLILKNYKGERQVALQYANKTAILSAGTATLEIADKLWKSSSRSYDDLSFAIDLIMCSIESIDRLKQPMSHRAHCLLAEIALAEDTGIELNRDEIIHFLLKSARNGDIQASDSLKTLRKRRDWSLTVEWYDYIFQMALNLDPTSLKDAIAICLNGCGEVGVRYADARKLLTFAFDKHMKSYCHLYGLFLTYGVGGPVDPREAMRVLEIGAGDRELGCEIQVDFALFPLYGLYCRQDSEFAKNLLNEAKNRGSVRSDHFIKMIDSFVWDPYPLPEKVASFYDIEEKNGNPVARVHLALHYQKSNRQEEALEILKTESQRENAYGRFWYWRLCSLDPMKSIGNSILRQAADAGYYEAEYWYSRVIPGNRRDTRGESQKYLKSAREKGHPDAFYDEYIAASRGNSKVKDYVRYLRSAAVRGQYYAVGDYAFYLWGSWSKDMKNVKEISLRLRCASLMGHKNMMLCYGKFLLSYYSDFKSTGNDAILRSLGSGEVVRQPSSYLDEALHWMEAALANGSLADYTKVGEAYMNFCEPPRLEQAESLLKKAYDDGKGDISAAFFIGKLFIDHRNKPEIGMEWYVKGSNKGNVSCYRELGRIHGDRSSEVFDYEKAKRYLRLCAMANTALPSDIFKYAMFLKEEETKESNVEAIAQLEKIRHSNAKISSELTNLKIRQNLDKEMKNIEEHLNAEGYFLLGIRNWRLERKREAKRLFERAEKMGFEDAGYMVGLCDMSKAIAKWKEAARHGVIEAMFHVGIELYETQPRDENPIPYLDDAFDELSRRETMLSGRSPDSIFKSWSREFGSKMVRRARIYYASLHSNMDVIGTGDDPRKPWKPWKILSILEPLVRNGDDDAIYWHARVIFEYLDENVEKEATIIRSALSKLEDLIFKRRHIPSVLLCVNFLLERGGDSDYLMALSHLADLREVSKDDKDDKDDKYIDVMLLELGNYHRVHPTDPNKEIALKFYSQAAERGNLDAQVFLEWGKVKNGSKNDSEKALKILKERHGSSCEAMYRVAKYFALMSEPRQTERASKILDEMGIRSGVLFNRVRRKIDLLRAIIQYVNWIDGHDVGCTMPREIENAFKLSEVENFRKGAIWLGKIYLNGYLGHVDVESAAKAFKRAADENYKDALFLYGYALQNSFEGIQDNVNAAVDYFRKAKKKKQKDAIAALEEYEIFGILS